MSTNCYQNFTQRVIGLEIFSKLCGIWQRIALKWTKRLKNESEIKIVWKWDSKTTKKLKQCKTQNRLKMNQKQTQTFYVCLAKENLAANIRCLSDFFFKSTSTQVPWDLGDRLSAPWNCNMRVDVPEKKEPKNRWKKRSNIQ